MEQTQIGGGSAGVWRGMEREECDKTGEEKQEEAAVARSDES